MSKKENLELPYMINLVMGDWSADGHSQTETVTIKSNLDKKGVEDAYKSGVKKTKVDLSKDVARDYEDNIISKKIVNKLCKFGFKIEDCSNDFRADEDGYGLWTDGYALAWLFIAQIGNPDFKYEVTNDDSPNINIGGYGLFA